MTTTPATKPRIGALAVTSRVLAAIFANYLLTAILVGLIARHLPIDRAQASVAATLTSFLIFAVIAIAIFSARSTLRMWVWMVGGIAVSGGLLWLSISIGGRL